MKKRRKRSLYKSITRLVLLVALVVFLASTIINARLSVDQVASLMGVTGEVLSEQLYRNISQVDGFEDFTISVMETYRSIPEAVREDPESAEYRAFFKSLEDSQVYQDLLDVLEDIPESAINDSAYLAMYDEATSSVVYIADSDSWGISEVCPVGFCEEVPAEEIAAFMGERGPSVEDALSKLEETESETELDEDAIVSEKARVYTGTTEKYGRVITAGKALLNYEGEILCFSMVDIPMLLAEITALIVVVIYLVVLALITVAIIVVSRIFVKRRVLLPIMQISAAAESYAADRIDGDVSTTHFEKLNIHTRDELEDLSHVMADMERDLGRYEKDLMHATAERERIQTELALASGIQDSMLPSSFPAFPDREDFDIYAAMDPAKEVGGDFYDFFLIDEDHLALVIADVSGKGVPAALFMMSSKIILNNYASVGMSPKEVLRKANEKICKMDLRDMFVTVWLGILDLKTGEVTAGNAGHEYPVLCQPGGDFELMHDRHNLVIGAMEGVPYGEYTFRLEKGAALFLYTDGVPEATDSGQQLYGTARMLKALNQVKDKDPQEILRAVRKDVDLFVKDEPQFDDLTMLCIRYKGEPD